MIVAVSRRANRSWVVDAPDNMADFLMERTSSRASGTRYAAKPLFQFRVDRGVDSGKLRICEERIVTLHAKSAKDAPAEAKRMGRKATHRYKNDEGNPVYFEFVGVMDLLELGIECGPNEVWYEIKDRLLPMERREQLIPPESQLCAIRNESSTKRRK